MCPRVARQRGRAAEQLGGAGIASPSTASGFGNAANNGRMLGEMDAKSPIVGTINEIAHVLTGRSEIKTKKKAGLGNLLGKLSRNKK